MVRGCFGEFKSVLKDLDISTISQGICLYVVCIYFSHEGNKYTFSVCFITYYKGKKPHIVGLDGIKIVWLASG